MQKSFLMNSKKKSQNEEQLLKINTLKFVNGMLVSVLGLLFVYMKKRKNQETQRIKIKMVVMQVHAPICVVVIGIISRQDQRHNLKNASLF